MSEPPLALLIVRENNQELFKHLFSYNPTEEHHIQNSDHLTSSPPQIFSTVALLNLDISCNYFMKTEDLKLCKLHTLKNY